MANQKNTQQEVIEIKRVEIQKAMIRIRGTAPLIMHKWLRISFPPLTGSRLNPSGPRTKKRNRLLKPLWKMARDGASR